MNSSKTDEDSYIVLETTSQALLFESILHAVRIIFELLLSSTERTQYELVLFESFVMTSVVAYTHIIQNLFIVYYLPFIVLILSFMYINMYQISYIVAGLCLVIDLNNTTSVWTVILFTLFNLRFRNDRSNLLLISSLLCLYFLYFTTSAEYTNLLAILCLEIASWGVERNMMPWIIEPSEKFGNFFIRFFIGFVIGVHIVDGKDENLLLVNNRYFTTFKGVAIYNNYCYLRFNASPLGILLSYLECLFNFVFQLIYSEEKDVIKVYFVGLNLVDVRLENYERNNGRSISLCASSRFPFRRILMGLLTRYTLMNA